MIINQHTANFGDDCAVAAVLNSLKERFPSSSTTIVYHDIKGKQAVKMPPAGNVFEEAPPLYLAKYDILSLCLYMFSIPFAERLFSDRIVKLKRTFGSADFIIVSPCGANIGVYRDWYFLMKIIVVLAAGKRPIFHLNTIGKSGHPLFDLLAVRVLQRSKVYVREAASVAYLAKAGVTAEQGVDSAFGLPALTNVEKIDEIVVVPTDLTKWFSSYKNFSIDKLSNEMASVLATVAQRNSLSVRIIPHIHSEGTEENLLESFAARVRTNAPALKVVVDPAYSDYRAYERRIASARAVVSMRYHGVVLAAKNAVPFVSVAYENKMQEVARYCGLSRLAFPISDWSSERFKKLLETAIAEREIIEMQLIERGQYLKELAHLPVGNIWLSLQK